MDVQARVRTITAVGLFPLLAAFTSACEPGAMLGSSGDAGVSEYTPNMSLPPPAHSQSMPCQDPDPTHLCVALNYVVYEDPAGQPIIPQAQAALNVQNVNSVWAQCQVQFYLENFTATNPATAGLDFQPSTTAELATVRADYSNNSQIAVITTGQWSGTLGSETANAWTEMPPVGPFGSVLEQSVAMVPNLIAHELGHSLNLVHVADQYDVMNPVVYSNSLNITESQCAMARATAISFWGPMLR